MRILRSNRSRAAGFTFIEAIVTAVIMGILAATTIPIYTGYVNSQRIDTLKSIAQMTAASANIYSRRTNTTPTCASTSACVTALGIFVSDPAQFDIQISGRTVIVKDLYHTDVAQQTASF
ncbi:MAG: prepilin-type N-terminal cleavage/methylation domain-containing protein [Fibrobacteres bacterium]|nr:prepilin-type N-terminal cleavage/methylation domain-containing protein [Fibrobacterota bacterium]